MKFSDDIPDPALEFARKHNVKFVWKQPWYKRVNWRYASLLIAVLLAAMFRIWYEVTI